MADAAGMRLVAVDIGATNLRVATFAEDGSILERCRRETPHNDGAEAIVNAVGEMVDAALPAGAALRGICVGVPAPVDPQTGYIDEASNLSELEGVSLLTMFQARLPGPVFVRNDAALAALGEHRYGAGRGARNMVYFTISTGIGGGLIVDDHLVIGTRGFAGEMGELLVPDTTGNALVPVALETVASGSAIATTALRALNDGEQSALREMASRKRITARVVAAVARGGDPVALRILRTAASSIGFGIVDILHLLNPARVVLGGGVMESDDLLMPVIQETVKAFAMPASLENVKIVRGTLGDDAGLFGAAAFLIDATTPKPPPPTTASSPPPPPTAS